MTRKQRRLTIIGGSLAVLAVAAALVLNAMRDSIVFFSTPAMVAEKHIQPGKRFRLGGLVQPGSLVRGDNLAVTFQVADGSATLPVSYKGILPDLFREGQGVVAEGALDASGVFKADTVLAKHDENYMPKDVADALKKQGHWKDEYGAKPTDPGNSEAEPGASRAARARRRPGRERCDDRGSRTLRAGIGAWAGADPVDLADLGRALARSRADECRALDRDCAADVRGGILRGAGHAARHLGFLRRQRVREFAFDETADLQDHRRLGQPRRLDAVVGIHPGFVRRPRRDLRQQSAAVAARPCAGGAGLDRQCVLSVHPDHLESVPAHCQSADRRPRSQSGLAGHRPRRASADALSRLCRILDLVFFRRRSPDRGPDRRRMGALGAALDADGLDIPHARHRDGLLLGLLRTRLGRLVVLGSGRECLADAVAGGHRAAAFRWWSWKSAMRSRSGPSCFRS